jgi:O-antigen ligase/tetratricopeptide (TPR) repeat protein
MRVGRLVFILLAFYFVLIGGSAYYYQIFAFRVAHHLIASAILLLWAIRRARGDGLPDTPLNAPIFAVIAVWLIGAAFSLDPRMALENVWLPLTHIGLFLIVADMIGRGRVKWVFEALFWVAGVVVILALAQLASWVFGLGVTPDTRGGWWGTDVFPPPESPMLYLPIGVSTWLAAWVAPLIVVAAAWARTAFRREYRPVLWALAVGLVIVLVGTGSRGGLIALGASIAAFVGLRVLDAARRRIDMRLVLAVGGVGALVVVLLIGRGEARYTGDALGVDLWRGAVTMIADRPIFGVGAGLFGRAYREARAPAYVDDRLSTAHNGYLNGIAENGIVGGIVGGTLLIALVIAWWRLRAAAAGDRRVRLDACMAALVGIGTQSLFDSFTTTTLVVPLIVLAACCVVPVGSPLAFFRADKTNDPAPRAPILRVGAWAIVAIFAGYALAFIPIDLAHNQHNQSLRLSLPESLEAARAAQGLDPALRLYMLQVEYLTAQAAEDDHAAAIAAYERALALEPTWDTGWINLAAAYERAGQIDAALAALDRAAAINGRNTATLHRARIADAHDAADDAAIIARYLAGMYAVDPVPRSGFWTLTPRRREAIAQFIRTPPHDIDARYRAAVIFDPAFAPTLIPDAPATEGEWWVVGEVALTRDLDPDAAAAAFARAIQFDPTDGDRYVALARAYTAFDPDAALRMLHIADLLHTIWESPHAVRARLTEDAEERIGSLAAAVPPRMIDQNFEAVLFAGRVASFELDPAMRPLDPGRAILNAWYELAALYEADAARDAAINVYRAIVERAPHESEAQVRLDALEGNI